MWVEPNIYVIQSGKTKQHIPFLIQSVKELFPRGHVCIATYWRHTMVKFSWRITAKKNESYNWSNFS